MRIFAQIIFINILFLFSSVGAFAQDNPCDQVPIVFSKVSQLRGLSPKKSVPCRIFTKEMAKKFVEERLKEELVPDENALIEGFLKTLKLIPKDYDLQKGLVDLYVAQIGGFYDPKDKFFAMAGWQSLLPQEIVLAHELTHALQDEHFDLFKFMGGKGLTLDEQLARQAVVEGDATLLMSDYIRDQNNQKPLIGEKNVDSLVLQTSLGTMFEQRAPQALVKLLSFPYSSGARFDHTLMRSGGGYSAIDLVYKNPPKTTREILHPELFLKGKKEFRVELLSEYRKCTVNSFGEFVMSLVLFENKVPEFSKIADGLIGDRAYRCATGPKAKSAKLVWDTYWSSAEDAEAFQNFIRPLSKKLTKNTRAGVYSVTAVM